MATIIATPGASDANSYVTANEAVTYFDERLPLSTPWDDNDYKEASLIMATRLLDAYFRGSKVVVPASGSVAAFYKIGPAWLGAPASTSQRLAWPRTGLLTQNGAELGSGAIPQEIKDAVCELAGQLVVKDTSLDNAAAALGITAVKAGPVGVNFKDGAILPKPLPDAVLLLIPAAWYTEEHITAAYRLDFEVIP